jgi:hypothetical protein
MKAGLATLLLLPLSILTASGQQLSYEQTTSGTNDFGMIELPTTFLDFEADAKIEAQRNEVQLGPTLRATGPLVYPIKGRGVLSFPGRLIQLVNPFSKANIGTSPARIEPVENRAWTTIVGWNPGRSAFPDDEHHEPQTRLISVSTSTDSKR